MPTPEGARAAPLPALPLHAAADLQDQLLMISHDLHRLQSLLTGTSCALIQKFHAAADQLRSLRRTPLASSRAPQALEAALGELDGAVVALQFEDMASQLIGHTHRRLRSCVDKLACQTFEADEDAQTVTEQPPSRPNPVTQDEMDAGSMELF